MDAWLLVDANGGVLVSERKAHTKIGKLNHKLRHIIGGGMGHRPSACPACISMHRRSPMIRSTAHGMAGSRLAKLASLPISAHHLTSPSFSPTTHSPPGTASARPGSPGSPHSRHQACLSSSSSRHPIFDEIRRDDLEAVQQRVLADSAVLEERAGDYRATPIVYAIRRKKPAAIPLWII